jgi:hypothetical protein
MRLSETQALFSQIMLDHPAALSNPDPMLRALFTCDENVLPIRLQIYRNNIIGSLTKAMQLTYPLIVILTGENFAAGMMGSFVRENPPLEACLARYGAGLDRFIETYAPARRLPYLGHVARLEWAMNESFYAPDDRPISRSDLEGIPHCELADMTLRLRSSVRLLESRWPLLAIREFCLQKNIDESETLDLNQGDCKIMVYRPALSVEVTSVDPPEYKFLLGVQAGMALGDNLESTLQIYSGFDFQEFLQKHLIIETFSGTPANT